MEQRGRCSIGRREMCSKMFARWSTESSQLVLRVAVDKRKFPFRDESEKRDQVEKRGTPLAVCT